MPEVNIGRGQVFQAFMVSLMIVVIDERLDLLFKITRQKVILQQYAILECLVPPFDLALRLRMIRRTTKVAHLVVAEPVSKLTRHVTRAIVRE